MAVQAQYPSNILLLNRNGQEVHDYSLQSQTDGFLDQSHMQFINGSLSNPRKRGRETEVNNMTSDPANPFSTQSTSQSPQLIQLSHLHNQQIQPNAVSTGLRLSFGDQQQLQNLIANSSAFSENFVAQIKQQIQELDQFLQAQGVQLRRALAEKRQRQYRALLGAAEKSVAQRLRDKEAEVEKAVLRNAELEARAAQLNVEVQMWQAKARAQEATVVSLQAQLQQAMMTCGAGKGAAQDSRKREEGLGGESEAEDAESAYIDPERVVGTGWGVSGPRCKGCRKREASMVVVPCGHLCLCTECDRVAETCPLCLTMKNSSVEVFLS